MLYAFVRDFINTSGDVDRVGAAGAWEEGILGQVQRFVFDPAGESVLVYYSSTYFETTFKKRYWASV